MKTKITVAYESVSSNTIRLLPEEIGELLAQCTERQLDTVLSTALKRLEYYGADEAKLLFSRSLKTARLEIDQITKNIGDEK